MPSVKSHFSAGTGQTVDEAVLNIPQGPFGLAMGYAAAQAPDGLELRNIACCGKLELISAFAKKRGFWRSHGVFHAAPDFCPT